MHHGKLTDLLEEAGADTPPVLMEAYNWLLNYAENAKIGKYELPITRCVVHVMEYALQGRHSVKFEAHKYVVDLQYTISGNEGIESAPLETCRFLGEYNVENDVQYLETPIDVNTFVENKEGYLTVLYPTDAHQPQRLTPDCTFVRKVVVKVPLRLL